MAVDFFGVYVKASLTTFTEVGGQTTFDLWTKSTENPLPDDLKALSNLAYVTEVQVEHMMGMNSRISLTLTPPFFDALEFINSPLIQWGVGTLRVTLGYSTGDGETLSEEFTGLLQKPDVQIGTDITITLNALGVGYSLSTSGGVKGRQFAKGTKWAEAIETILQDYKDLDKTNLWEDFGIQFGQAKTANVDHDLFKPRFGEKIKDKNSFDVQEVLAIDVGPRNDWWFLHETCRRFGLDVFIEGNKVFIKNRDKWLAQHPSSGIKRFHIRGGVDPKNNLFPVLNLASPSAGEWLKQGGGEVVQSDTYADKSGANTATHDDQSTKPTRTQGATIDKTSNLAGPVQNVGMAMPGNPGWSESAATGVGQYKNTTYMMGIKIEVETIGIPNLRAGEVILLSGTENSQGKSIFNGQYGVLSVVHTIGLGGYSCSFTALGNFLPHIFANAVKSAGPITQNAGDFPSSTNQVGLDGKPRIEMPSTGVG